MNTAEITTNLLSADEYRAKAADCRKSEAESWERSDTDGFLSQWASLQMASRYDHLATIADNGGILESLALFLNGELASTDQRSGQYGLYWVLNDAATAIHGKRFFTGSQARNSVERDRAKGFTYGTVSALALVNRDKRPFFHPDAELTIVATDGAYSTIEADEAARA